MPAYLPLFNWMSCEFHINVIWTSYELVVYFTGIVYRKIHVNFMQTSYKLNINYMLVSYVIQLKCALKVDFLWTSYELHMHSEIATIQQPSRDTHQVLLLYRQNRVLVYGIFQTQQPSLSKFEQKIRIWFDSKHMFFVTEWFEFMYLRISIFIWNVKFILKTIYLKCITR